MGVRAMERFLEQWQMEVKDLRRRMILAPTPRERGALVRNLAAGPRLDVIGDGAGPGTEPSHHQAPSTSSGGRRPSGRTVPQP